MSAEMDSGIRGKMSSIANSLIGMGYQFCEAVSPSAELRAQWVWFGGGYTDRVIPVWSDCWAI
jgi:hypothetical protein